MYHRCIGILHGAYHAQTNNNTPANWDRLGNGVFERRSTPDDSPYQALDVQVDWTMEDFAAGRDPFVEGEMATPIR